MSPNLAFALGMIAGASITSVFVAAWLILARKKPVEDSGDEGAHGDHPAVPRTFRDVTNAKDPFLHPSRYR